MVVDLKKQVALFVEGPGDSQVDSAAASQDGFNDIFLMGTDIYMYMEYRSRKKKRYMYYDEFRGKRIYGLFEAMAEVFLDTKPLFKTRGLPDDVTPQVLKLYKDFGGNCLVASWLTADEFRSCLDLAIERYSKDAPEGWLKEYELIYKYLKDSDDEDEPARIVFWFD